METRYLPSDFRQNAAMWYAIEHNFLTGHLHVLNPTETGKMRRSTARKLKPHLPALGRYIRSVTGSRRSEKLMERTLEQVSERDYRVLASRDVRTRLFRDFHDLWVRRPQAADADPITDGVSEVDRHGLMLRHAQGFSVQDVAAILRCDVLDLTDKLQSAYGDMHRLIGSDVLLIEEDPVMANGMTETIESMGHRVLGVARNSSEAQAAAGTARLDAVVADFDRVSDGRNDATMDRLLDGINAPIVLVLPGIDDGEDRRDAPPYAIATPFQPAELKVLLTQALQNRRNAARAS
jgi:DNA-directed RNA polymerase specialized sigma24 family protein